METIKKVIQQSTLDKKEAELILSYVLNKNRVYIKAHCLDLLNEKQIKSFKILEKRRLKNEPIAYIVKNQPFYGRSFLVNRHTLIPRPETEQMIDLVKNNFKDLINNSQTLIIDIGTGTGCIGITMKLDVPKAHVLATDISNSALKVAKQNAKNLKADINFIKSNLLGTKIKTKIKEIQKKYNIINTIYIANLPYLPASYKKDMLRNVTAYEPNLALFAGSDGLDLINQLLKQIKVFNKPNNYSIFLEIDSSQTQKLSALCSIYFPKHKIIFKKDFCGRTRFVEILGKTKQLLLQLQFFVIYQ